MSFDQADSPPHDRCREPASLLLGVCPLPVLAAEPDDFVEVRIAGEHAERLAHTARGPQRNDADAQHCELGLQVADPLLQLLQRRRFPLGIADSG